MSSFELTLIKWYRYSRGTMSLPQFQWLKIMHI